MKMRKYIPVMEHHFEKLFEGRGFISKDKRTKLSRIGSVRNRYIKYGKKRHGYYGHEQFSYNDFLHQYSKNISIQLIPRAYDNGNSEDHQDSRIHLENTSRQ